MKKNIKNKKTIMGKNINDKTELDESKKELIKDIEGFFLSFLLFFSVTFGFVLLFLLLFTAAITPVNFINLTVSVIVLSVVLTIDILLIAYEYNNNWSMKYDTGAFVGIMLGIFIVSIYIIPGVNVMQYPISMKVFYPNHPNITIIQNCTDFTTTASGYLNGQPLNPKNTTSCNFPPSMDPNNLFYEPFSCNINKNSITCTAFFNVTWEGTILNVSKRKI
jgi:hypothetical protein